MIKEGGGLEPGKAPSFTPSRLVAEVGMVKEMLLAWGARWWGLGPFFLTFGLKLP